MSIYEKNELSQSRDWLHELARNEVNSDARQLGGLGADDDITQLVEEKTMDFLETIRQQISEYAKIFNAYAEGGKNFFEVKIYRVADKEADFMLFRNQVKLVFSLQSSGVVRITYLKHNRNILAVNEKLSQSQKADETFYDICAEVGPFREILFHYQGHRVAPSQVAKFYFSEFVKATRIVKSQSSDRDVLLNQIKSLLQEKGLNL